MISLDEWRNIAPISSNIKLVLHQLRLNISGCKANESRKNIDVLLPRFSAKKEDRNWNIISLRPLFGSCVVQSIPFPLWALLDDSQPRLYCEWIREPRFLRTNTILQSANAGQMLRLDPPKTYFLGSWVCPGYTERVWNWNGFSGSSEQDETKKPTQSVGSLLWLIHISL